MSTTTSGGSTARDVIEQYLRDNSGWHTVKELVNATGYSTQHVRRTAKDMASNGTIKGRKNSQKPVIGYEINGDWKVPGSDATALRRLIRVHASSVPSNLTSMSVSALQKRLRYIADDDGVVEHKLEFRMP